MFDQNVYNHLPEVRARRLESWKRRMADPAYREKERLRSKAKFQRDKLKVYAYKKTRREKERPYFAKYNRERRKIDPQWTIQNRLRSRMAHAIRVQRGKKSTKTYELTGCTIQQLCAHIESKFKPGMTWENRNLWEIDHVMPLSKFNLLDESQQRAAFHFSNLEPLWTLENRKKSNKILARCQADANLAA